MTEPLVGPVGPQTLAGEWLVGAPAPISEYGLYAEAYDLDFDSMDQDVQFWMELVQAHDAVAEIGCGTGRLTQKLAARTSRVPVGIDSSPQMLARAGGRTDKVDWRLGDLRDLPARDHEFDAVLCPKGSFAYLPSPVDQLRAARELSRVLAPGGRLVIDVPFRSLGDPTITGDVPLHPTHEAGDERNSASFEWLSVVDRRWNLLEIVQAVDIRKAGHLPRKVFVRHRTHIFTANELVFVLLAEGMQVDEVYGNYRREPFDGTDDRLIVLAYKPC